MSIPERVYKTSEKMRRVALAYYYTNKEERLAYAAEWRRAHGIAPRRWMTDEEKQSRRILCRTCRCEVTTPSFKRRGRHECHRCLRHRIDTPEKRRERMKQWRRVVSTRYRALKADLTCVGCGTRENLDFHHRDPQTKLMKVSRLVYRASWAKLLAEIAKCDPLCKTCHNRIHPT